VTTESWIALAGVGLALVGYAAALVVHHVGRSTSVLPGLLAAGIGLLLGTWLVTTLALLAFVPAGLVVGDSLWAIIPLAAVPVTVVVLMRRGSRRFAGAFLTAGAVAWLVTWFGAVDRLRQLPGGGALLGAGAPVGFVALVIGVALLVVRDPAADPRHPDVQARKRRIGAFGAALMGRARMGPVTPAFIATIVTVGVLSAPEVPALAGVLLPVAVAVVATELELRILPRTVRPAIEAFHWVGRGELARFKAITGRSFPVTRGAATTWLATPASEADLSFRAELLVWLDRRPDALAVVAQMPERTPVERLQKALEADFIAWTADGHERGIDFDALARDVDDEAERLRADGLVAYRASQHRFAAGEGDWLAPLTTFRSRLGHAADGLHARSMRMATLIPTVVVALLFSIVAHAS
jgi:hypothetical protein